MLRSFDADGGHFAFRAVESGPDTGKSIVEVEHGPQGATATIDDAHLLFNAEFKRAGSDLVLTGDDGKTATVHHYFDSNQRVTLRSAEGATLSPDVVDALAGSLAPGQYAQATPAQANAEAVGRVATVSGNATIMRNGVAVTVSVGDAVLKGDVLQTGSGAMGVTFNDSSTLNLTANSRLVVNEFVYDPNGTANSQLISLVQGSLTMISGQVAHTGTMKVDTPVATMGIRGTFFGVTDASDGAVQVWVNQSTLGIEAVDHNGAVLGTITQDGPMLVFHPSPLQVLVQEMQRGPQQIANELSALQAIIATQSVGQRLIDQYFNPNNPNPQSTDHAHTQFDLLILPNNTQNASTNGFGDSTLASGVADNIKVQVTTQTVVGPTITDQLIQTVVVPQTNLPPVVSSPPPQQETPSSNDAPIIFTAENNNAVTVSDPDTPVLTVTLTATHGLVALGQARSGLVFAPGDTGNADDVMTFSGTQQDINTALNGLVFSPTPTPGNHQATLQIAATDGTNTTTQIINFTTDAQPVVNPGSAASYTEHNSGVPIVGSGFQISDADDATLQSATVTLTNRQAGDLLSVSGTLPGNIQSNVTADNDKIVITLTGAASLADYQAALQQIVFSSGDNPDTTDRDITITVNDGIFASDPAHATVHVTQVNDPPVIVDPTQDTNQTPEDTQLHLVADPGIVVSDPDAGSDPLKMTLHVEHGTLTLPAIPADLQALVSDIQGNGTDTITLLASQDTINRLIHEVGVNYLPSQDYNGNADFTFTVNDQGHNGAGGAQQASITVHIDVTPVNDPPVVAANGGSASYTESAAPVAIDTALTVSDVDSANLAGATVAITNFHAGEDALGFATQNGITGSFDTNTGILTLSGIASVSDYQTALRSVTYSNSSDNPSSDTRTISFQVDDGSSANHASNVVTTTVAVNPVNNPPVVAANGGSLSYTENGAAAIDTALTVSDVDSTNLVGATASIANFHAGEDVLGFTAQAGITGAFDSNTGILSLSGSASVAAYQAVLRSVTYSNTSDNPSADARTINYQVNDGSAPSNVATATVSVAPVNDPPVIVDPSDDTNQTAEDTQLHLVADPTIIVSDPDAGSDPLKATLHVEHGTLTLPTIPADLQGLITGLQGDGTATITFLASQDTINRLIHEVGVNYHPNHDFNGNADFTFTVDDQGHNGAGGALNAHTTVHIAVTPVNDAPVLAANGGSATYAENAPPTAIDTVLTISDVDSTNLAGATVSITGNFHQGQDVLGFASQNGITGDYNANTGVLTLSGISTLANYQAALQSVTYSNSSDNPSSDPRTISFRVDDGSSANNTSNVVTATVSVTPANDAPQLDAHTGGSSSQYTENGAAVAVDSAITINDIDSPTLAGATVSIGTGFHASEDRLNFTNQSTITGSYNSATGILTLVGFASLADYQTALASVTYSNTSDNPSSDIRTVSFQVDDGSAANNLSNVVTASVSVTPVNDAPAVNAHGGSLTYTENGPAAAIDTALTVGDVDSANLTGATVSITGNFHSGEDTLGFVDQNGIHGVYNNGVLTLSGSASVADYQAALRSVSYSDSSDDPSGDTRTISFQVNDGSATNNLSNVATATVSVTPVNDVPVITSVNSTGGVPTAALSLTAASYLTHDNSLVSGLGGNAGFGEQFLDRNDDGSTGAITIGGTATSVFGIDGLNFFGHTYTSLYINNNGNITFNGPQSSFTPSQITAGFGNPIIAPFWADVDTRGGSGNSDLVYYDLDSANHVLTVTWYDVGYYSQHTDKVDAFQLQLIGLGDGNFDIVYRYDDITWTTGDASGGSGGLGGTPARIGYSAGDGNPNHYFELSPLSGTNSVVNVDTDPGNQGNNPGVYLFQVLNGSVAPASVANGTIDFTDPDSGDHHSATVTPPATHLGNLVVGSVTEPTGNTQGSVAWEFDLSSTDLNGLSPGQTRTETYQVTVSDNNSGQTTQTMAFSWGSAAADTFSFAPQAGADTVLNFQLGTDALDFNNGANSAHLGPNMTSADASHILDILTQNTTHDAVLNFGNGDTVTLAGVSFTNLQNDLHNHGGVA